MKPMKIIGALTSFLTSRLGEDKKAGCCAVLLAAGSASRMGGMKKCFLSLGDTTVLESAFSSFEQCDFIKQIVIVTKADMLDEVRALPRIAASNKNVLVVSGGQTRQDSASLGFYAVNDECEFVAIHDAARPFITKKQIEDVYWAAKKYGAACASYPVTDTVKRANPKGFITETVDRNGLHAVQTPQIFKKSLYAASLAAALRDKIEVTDDCMLAEHAGFKVRLINTGKQNIKLTHPEDYETARHTLKTEEV